jgi:hypothetical protein
MLSRIRGTAGTNLKASASSAAKSSVKPGVSKLPDIDGIDFGPTAVFHEKFPNIGKPFLFDEQDWLTFGDGDGYQDYFPRKGRVKEAVKWGQLKLLITEMQFFNKYWDPKVVPAPLCVYVGSAPGTHIPFLADLFPWFTFHLYDPRDVFDEKLKSHPKVKLHVKFFTEADAKSYAKRKDVFLFSDIRSSAYNKEQFSTEEFERDNEKLVLEDLERQKLWYEIINPVRAQLKFRLPYGYGWQKAMPERMNFSYLDGDIYRQAWAPQTSTETRLVPTPGALPRAWNSQLYEKMCFYHNNVIREHAKFVNPVNGLNEDIDRESGLTQDYDSTITVVTVKDYLTKFSPSGVMPPEHHDVIALTRAIIEHVGKGDINLVNIRAGYKGKLSPDVQEKMQKKLKAAGDDEDE